MSEISYNIVEGQNSIIVTENGKSNTFDYIHSINNSNMYEKSYNDLYKQIKNAKSKIVSRYMTTRKTVKEDLGGTEKNPGLDRETITSILSGELFTRAATIAQDNLKKDVDETNLGNFEMPPNTGIDLEKLFKELDNRMKKLNRTTSKISKEIKRAEQMLKKCTLDSDLGTVVVKEFAGIEAYNSIFGSDDDISKSAFKEKIKQGEVVKIEEKDLKQYKSLSKNGLATNMKRMLSFLVGLNSLSDKQLQTRIEVTKKRGGKYKTELIDALAGTLSGYNSGIQGVLGETIGFSKFVEGTQNIIQEEAKRGEDFKKRIKITHENIGADMALLKFKCEAKINDFKEHKQYGLNMNKLMEPMTKGITEKTDNIMIVEGPNDVLAKIDFSVKDYDSVEVTTEIDKETNKIIKGNITATKIGLVNSTPLLYCLNYDLYLDRSGIINFITIASASNKRTYEGYWANVKREMKKVIAFNSLVGRENEKDHNNLFIKINNAIIPLNRIFNSLARDKEDTVIITEPENIISKRGSLQRENSRRGLEEDNVASGFIRSERTIKTAYERIQDTKLTMKMNFNNFRFL